MSDDPSRDPGTPDRKLLDPPPQFHDELLLRCSCGVEMLEIDLWFTTNAADFRTSDKAKKPADSRSRYFDEGYLTITQGYGWNQPWRGRIKAAWALLRGREYVLSSLILEPEHHKQIREFFGAAE